MSKFKDIAGQQFGRLTVVECMPRAYRPPLRYWRCRCICGNETIVRASALQLRSRKPPQSCGCWRFDFARTHGMTRINGKHSPTFESWHAMLQRCTNPKINRFMHYGGRGITVCDRWHQFENFFADMGERPPGLTLDRIDNDGNYEPSNCRWATVSEQNSNQQRHRSKHADATR
jgi:hypothetical protein